VGSHSAYCQLVVAGGGSTFRRSRCAPTIWYKWFIMNTAGFDDSVLEKSAYRKASVRILPLIALGYGPLTSTA